MKDDLEKLYGREWHWYKSLTLIQKIKVIWFALSIGITLGICDSSNVFTLIIMALNLAASSISLISLPDFKDD